MAQPATLIIRISPELKARLRLGASKEGVTLSQFCRKVLQSHSGDFDNTATLDHRNTTGPVHEEQPATLIPAAPLPAPPSRLEDDGPLMFGCPF